MRAIASREYQRQRILTPQLPKPVQQLPMLNAAIGVCGWAQEWQQALVLLSEFAQRRLQCTSYTYNAAAAAFGSSRQWAQVLALVDAMMLARTPLDPSMQRSAAKSAEVGNRQMQIDLMKTLSTANWQEAIASVTSLKQQSLQADVRVHNAVLCACRRSECWKEALDYFENLTGHHNVVMLTTLLGTMGDAGRWQDALKIFWDATDASVGIDLYTSVTMLEALRTSGKWEWTLALLSKMLGSRTRDQLPAPDTMSFNVAISAGANSGQWQLAFALLHVMASEKRADATPNVRDAQKQPAANTGKLRFHAEGIE
eukprot:g1276.t1